MAGWINMPLSREVGLGPSDIVLDGDPAPLPQKGPKGAESPNFRPMSIVVKGLNGSRCMTLGTEGHLGIGHIVPHGDPCSSPSQEGVLCPFRGAMGTRLIQCGLCGGLLPYQVASSSIQPFGHNSVGCHSPRRNISTYYFFVVEMHTITVRSDDARYLLKKLTNCLV